jgi:NADH dehydrogenase
VPGVPGPSVPAGDAGDAGDAGHAGLWAIGDCALVPNAESGTPAPPTAQFAVAEAHALAGNLLARLQGLPTRPFAYRSKGMVATTGHLKGVAQLGRVKLSGLPAWLLWRAYYLSRMPTLGRKVRLWAEWTLAMLFAADITHLRFQGTREVDAPEAASARNVRR